jgi:hypothetical protein
VRFLCLKPWQQSAAGAAKSIGESKPKVQRNQIQTRSWRSLRGWLHEDVELLHAGGLQDLALESVYDFRSDKLTWHRDGDCVGGYRDELNLAVGHPTVKVGTADPVAQLRAELAKPALPMCPRAERDSALAKCAAWLVVCGLSARRFIIVLK